MPQTSFALMTTLGRSKEAAALANATTIEITEIAIGDGVTVPSGGETALYNEVDRFPIAAHGVVVGASNVAYFDAFLAAEDGPYTIREAGLYDSDGDLIAIAHYNPAISKPTPDSGQTVEGTVRLEVAFSNVANITILVDPSMQVALQRLSRLPWIPVISMTTTAPPSSPTVGDCYLVPSGATGAWAGQAGKIAERTVAGWAIITPADGHGISLPDGRIFEKISGAYIEKIALDVQSGKWTYAAATGTANAWVVAPSLAVPAYAAGRVLWIIAPATNTSTTVNANVSGLGNRRIKKSDGSDPQPSDLRSGVAYPTIDDGTNIRVVSALPSDQLAAPYLGFHGDPVSQSIPSNTATLIAGYTNIVNGLPGATYSGGVIVIGTTGFYSCTCNMGNLMPTGANYGYNVTISKVDGSNVPLMSVASQVTTVTTASLPSSQSMSASGIVKLTAGDRIAGFFTHNQGGPQNMGISLDIEFRGT